ncbi:unnamed protein product [Mytilus edulis]|uniref:Protein kinase domain-containing protein n=1 Tax=Mytilus edulis TaxID=6550 RepID=A0A8S3U3V2_MYTED|nr:unnamed protein product [Mytilus edulis]
MSNNDDDIYFYGAMETQGRDTWAISRQDLSLETELARGRFAIIYLAQYFNHQDVRKVVAKTLKGGPIMILEYCPKGVLKEFLESARSNVTVDLEERLFRITLAICEGMDYLSSQQVVHRRLAARNVLLNDQYVPKNHRIRPGSGSNSNRNRRHQKICKYNFNAWYKNTDVLSVVKRGTKMKKPELCDDVFYKIMLKCWHYDPRKRSGFEQIKEELSKLFTEETGDDDYYMYYKSNENVQSIPSVPISSVQSIPSVPISSVQSIPSVPISSVQSISSVPISSVQSIPSVPISSVQSISSVPISSVQSIPSVPISSVQSIPSVPISSVQSIPSVPISSVQSISRVPISSVQSIPSVPISSVQSISSVPISSVQSIPSVPISSVQSISSVPISSVQKIGCLPPVKPNGGDIYLIHSKHPNDWKCDQYTWINESKFVSEIVGVKLNRCYFKLRLPGFDTKSGRKRPRSTSDFKRIAYWLDSNPNLVLIHYIGNEDLYQPMPHGNSKHDTEFVRTMPSVIDTIKEKEGNPHKVYKKMICTNDVDGSHQAVANPRNTKQVKNILSKERQEKALSKDDIYNLVLLAYQLDGFVSEVLVYPDLYAVVALPEIINAFKDIIELKSEDPVYLVYDTTFNLGDCYVSPIVFKHVIFDETPLVPLAFFIHERKHAKWHEVLFKFLKDKIPRIDKKTNSFCH